VGRRRYRRHTREFKLAALARLDAAPDVQALARELDVERTLLYRWQGHFMKGGAAALRNSGRPRPTLMVLPAAGLPDEAYPAPWPEASSEASSPGPPEATTSLAAYDPAAATRRIMELERKVGQQQLELDFFRAALRHVREPRR
jgi:transposase